MDVGAWLKSLGLEQYEAAFRENAVTAELLPTLTADDLKDLGITLVGHRRQLLNAIVALRSQAASAEPVAAVSPSPPVDPSGPPDASESMAERRPLSVMFCDLIGSTALSARLDPEDLREVIRTYQARVAATIQQFNGFIARYVGDGVLIYFGWPQAHETDAARAVRAGLSVAAAISETRVGGEPLQVRIGVATGLVVIGEPIGAGDARQQTAIGETPNRAARLQSLAGPGQVMIDAATRRQIGGLFDCRDLGTIELKGLPEPVPTWQVVSENRAVGQFEALRSGLTPMVGREEELELLLRRWTQAKAGSGKVVLISAEPGVGKSRLAEALAERIAAEPHIRLRYFCSPHHQDSALYPLIAHMERAAGFAHGDAPEVRLAKLQTLLAAAELPPEDVALIAELHGLPSGDLALPLDLTPQRKKEKTFEALLRQLEGLSRQHPVLMVFDDLHWIDPSTRELLDRTIERIARWPVLLLALFRPEFQPPWVGQPQVTMLTLARLDQRDTAAMVANVAGDAALPPEIVTEIAERTDGVPLFVEELTKAVLEAGAQAPATLSAMLHPALSVPPTLHASLMARLDRLGPAAREVAQAGAAIGHEFGYGLLACIIDLPEPQLREALDRLTAAGLVFARGTPPEVSYLFKHALVQDVAYGSLLRNSRQRLHERIVTTLEHQFPDIVANEPERIARACIDAGQDEKALKYLLKSAEESVSRSANLEALNHTEKALKILHGLRHSAKLDKYELRLLLLRGVALQAVHGYGSQDVSDNYTRAHELCRAISDAPELIPVLRGLYVNHLMKGNLPAAHDIAGQLLRLADQTENSGWRLEARFALGQTLAFHEVNLPRARDVLAEGAMLYDLEKHRHHAFLFGQDPGVYCLILGGFVQYFLGYPDTAFDNMHRAILLSDSVGHSLSRAAARVFTVQLQQWLRHDAAFRELAAETIDIARSQNLPFFQAWVSLSLGWHSVSKGNVESGRQTIVTAIQAWLESAGELFVPYSLCLLAEAHALAGELEEALAKITEGFAMAERNGDRFMLSEMHRLAGHVFESGERLADAEKHYRQAIRRAREQQAKSWELRSTTDLGRLLIARGNRAEAATLLGPICKSFTEALDSLDLVDAKTMLATAKRTT